MTIAYDSTALYQSAANRLATRWRALAIDTEVHAALLGENARFISRMQSLVGPSGIRNLSAHMISAFANESRAVWAPVEDYSTKGRYSTLCSVRDLALAYAHNPAAFANWLHNLYAGHPHLEQRLRFCVGGPDSPPLEFATSLLHVAFPAQCPSLDVNLGSQLRFLGLHPGPGASGQLAAYLWYTSVLQWLRAAISCPDMWFLQRLLALDDPRGTGRYRASWSPPAPRTGRHDTQSVFRSERELQEYLYQRWDETTLGRDWTIYRARNGKVGFEYPTSIGRIDLLAKARTETGWLVVELKSKRTSDQVVGQVRSYMGWVGQNLAVKNQSVQGLIILPEITERLRMAVLGDPTLHLMTFGVLLQLTPVS